MFLFPLHAKIPGMDEMDRRNYNRLEVFLLFSCKPLASELTGKNSAALTAADNPFAPWFREQRPPLPPSSGELDELTAYYRKITHYLEMTERKISLLSRIIFQPSLQKFFQQQPLSVTLSATGVSFPAPKPIETGSRVQLTFFLPHNAQLINTQALILRSLMQESRDPKQAYVIAAQFVDLAQEIEDEIARFIIISERKQLHQSRCHHEEKA